MTFKIGKRFVGKNHPPLIIAELGINHNGSLKKQKTCKYCSKKRS